MMSLDPFTGIRKLERLDVCGKSLNDVLRTNVVEIEGLSANGNYNYIRDDQYRKV